MISTPLLTNPLVYAAAILSVALASQQAGLMSTHSGSLPHRTIERPGPAVQTVNRAAKGDKRISAPQVEPREMPARDARQRVIVAANMR
jgi:hypothetical protein